MELGLNRRNVARLVLVAWAVALTWLARRQFATPSGAAGDPRGNRLAPGAWYYAVYAGGRQVGQLNLSVDTLIEGVRLTEQFVVDVPSGDTTRQIAQGSDYFLSRSLWRPPARVAGSAAVRPVESAASTNHSAAAVVSGGRSRAISGSMPGIARRHSERSLRRWRR